MLHRRPDLSKSVPRLDFLDVTRQLSGGPDRENVSYFLTFDAVLETLATIYANRKWITTFWALVFNDIDQRYVARISD